MRIPLALSLSAFLSASLADGVTHTNLPATITTITTTNVITGDNSSGCNLCFDEFGNRKGPYSSYTPAVVGPPCQPFRQATERWIITNIFRLVTIDTTYQGKPITYSDLQALSSATNRMTLHKEWRGVTVPLPHTPK